MQLYEGEYQIAREALDEFFKGWVFVQDVFWYIPSEAERQKAPWCIAQNSQFSMKNYLQIVELYAVNVLVKGLKNEELALKWLEKLNILEESRQEIALKIKSVSRLQESKSVKCFSHPSSSHEQKLSQAKDLSLSKGVTEFSQMSKALSGSKEHLQTVDICTGSKENSVVSRFSKLVESLLLWFPALPLRLGNLGIALPHGKTILILASTLFIFYLLKNKSKNAIRKLKEQSQVVRRVLIDFWQLAFNVQLNPLAAVQSLPSAPHVSREEFIEVFAPLIFNKEERRRYSFDEEAKVFVRRRGGGIQAGISDRGITTAEAFIHEGQRTQYTETEAFIHEPNTLVVAH